MLHERPVVESGIRVRKQIQVPEARPQREDVTGPQRALVHRRRYTRRHVTTDRREVEENAGKSMEVVILQVETDIDIQGQRRRPMDLGRQTSDQDESSISLT